LGAYYYYILFEFPKYYSTTKFRQNLSLGVANKLKILNYEMATLLIRQCQAIKCVIEIRGK